MSTLVEVNLKQGKIVGEEIFLPYGRRYFKFFGIPYAKPPIGDLRFKNPQPLEEFPCDSLDCTEERNKSLQMDLNTKKLYGSEDCLYLNIHTPRLRCEQKFPVMVWIHGGSFVMGSGNRYILYSQYLLEQNIVLVTVNYRLGAFGFLSLPSAGISGNFGLKDQQLALKWINENIHQFNGDTNNVTIFGHSAGGASVHFQLMSEKSRKYFHKVICQSGLSTMKWALDNNPETKALKLAELLGFKNGSACEVAEFLQKYDNYNELIENMFDVVSDVEKTYLINLPFRPVIEIEGSDETFMTQHPLEIMRQEGLFKNIPVMMGYTSIEGIMIVGCTDKTLDDINSNMNCLLPYTVCAADQNVCNDIIKKVKNYYFNGNSITHNNTSEFGDLLSDIYFIVDFYKTAKLHIEKQSESPLYCYRFSYDGKLNCFKTLYKHEHIKGATHGDELNYIFYPTELCDLIIPDDNDIKMVKKMCKLWTNFAKCGNPTPSDSCNSVIDFIWNPVDKVDNECFILDCLDININPVMVNIPENDRIQFIRKYFPNDEF